MGFINSGATVSVEAKLTHLGKKRLYQLIEGDANFISRFTLGDSDTNYKAVPTSGPLDSGYVPEPGDFKPKLRSTVLHQGMFRPGRPVILFNNEIGPITREFSIGQNAIGTYFDFEVKTQWPTGEDYTEEYYVAMQNPTSLSDEVFNRAFNLEKIGSTTWRFTFVGNLSSNEMEQLIGESNDAQTDILIPLTGKKSNKWEALRIILTY